VTKRVFQQGGPESVRDLGVIDFPRPRALRGWSQLRMGRLLTRVRGRLQRGSLTAALARGVDPCESAALAYCSTRLTRDRTREKLAEWVERVLDAAARPRLMLTSAVEPRRDEVMAAPPADPDGGVAAILDALYTQGLAMLDQLLRDGGGPLYWPTSRGALSRELELILAGLAGRDLPDDR
jgi:hypothetical protein